MKKNFRMAMVCALAGATLLYTGCTKDYSPELSDINKRVTALEQDTKVAQLEERIKTLSTSIDDLKAANVKLNEALNGKASQAEFSALQGKVKTIEETTIPNLENALNNYKELVSQTYATKDELDAVSSKIGDIDGTVAGEISRLEGLVGGLRSEFDTLSGEFGEYKTKVDEAIGDIATVTTNLKGLLNLIMATVQSVVFVPEYTDLNATMNFVLFNHEELIGEPVISGTFQVKPERLASKVKADYEGGLKDVYMQLVNTKSRAAEDYIKSDDLEIVSADDQTGYIVVNARFNTTEPENVAQNKVKALQAVSLWIEDPVVSDYAEASTDPVEGLASICSPYVPVTYEVVVVDPEDFVYGKVVEDEFVPYGNDPDLDPRFETDFSKTVRMPWNDNSTVAFHDGCSPVIYFDVDEFYTCADFEAKYFLPAGSATPTIVEKDLKYYKNGSSDTPIEEEFVFTSTEEGVDEVNFAIAEGSTAKWLFDNAVSLQSWEFNETPVFSIADRFIVDRIKTISLIEGSETVDWTYDFAVKHSNTPAIPYGEPGVKLENVQPLEFEEKTVDATVVKTAALEAVTDAVVYSYDPEADEWVLEPLMSVTYTAVDEDNVDIDVNGYTFSNEAAVEYKAVASFIDDDRAAITEVVYLFTLGQKPASFETTKDIVIDYIPLVTTTNVLPAEMPEDVKDELLLYFKDNEEFLYGLAKSKVTSNAVTVTTGGEEKAGSTYSYLKFSEENGVQTRLSQADVYTYEDSYVYVAEIETWYDVDYKVTVNATLADPGYDLAYWTDFVNLEDPANPYAMLKGKYAINPDTEEGQPGKAKLADYDESDVVQYVITSDNLSRYFRIDNKAEITEEEKALLTIVYEAVTVEDIPAGYTNVPVINNAPKPIATDFSIPEEKVAWKDYSARDFEVCASLYCNKVLVTSLPLTLNILDPIAKFEVKDNTVTVKRKNYENAVAYLWKNFNITGVLEPDFSLINNEATTAAEAFVNGNPYQAVLNFNDSDLETFIGDEPFELVGSKITYDAPNGVITYHDDSAWMQKPVKVKVKASLEHKFNYLWPEQDTASSEKNHIESVEFWVVFEQDGTTPTPNAL